ncbi:uncharacterized protein LOC121392499 [Gigantopelta aegis]|uniref:uncharacterized protein LOC121392499 n=1 Tax=Gigantopelta aegis TaxID=1735272 RepID=UPI001B88E1DE|nr:uncharacterized protein LOC121392499 [Gigantopelta aegis]
MDVDEGMLSNLEKLEKNQGLVNKEDVHIKIAPGKDIIITIDGLGNGVTYTRWGKKTCRKGVELVYEGYAGGGLYTEKGNGANFICLPKDPQYLSSTVPTWESKLYGAEYETNNKIFDKPTHNYNVPCAVCLAPKKSTKLMIPAKVSCPKSWTREYYGYLMTSFFGHNRNALYECVDHNPDIIPGTAKDTNGALFYFTVAMCNYGLPCRPYIPKRAVTCAVCTK